MTIAEFENAVRPPIVGNYPAPVLTTEDIMSAAYRLKQKYGIRCIKGVRELLGL